jgi:hypothetical protein
MVMVHLNLIILKYILVLGLMIKFKDKEELEIVLSSIKEKLPHLHRDHWGNGSHIMDLLKIVNLMDKVLYIYKEGKNL